jgi:hypothetical protein
MKDGKDDLKALVCNRRELLLYHSENSKLTFLCQQTEMMNCVADLIDANIFGLLSYKPRKHS